MSCEESATISEGGKRRPLTDVVDEVIASQVLLEGCGDGGREALHFNVRRSLQNTVGHDRRTHVKDTCTLVVSVLHFATCVIVPVRLGIFCDDQELNVPAAFTLLAYSEIWSLVTCCLNTTMNSTKVQAIQNIVASDRSGIGASDKAGIPSVRTSFIRHCRLVI